MKFVLKILKKVIFSFILLYTYNLIAVSFNLIIPINIYTISLLSIFDFPGLLLLATLLKIYY